MEKFYKIKQEPHNFKIIKVIYKFNLIFNNF